MGRRTFPRRKFVLHANASQAEDSPGGLSAATAVTRPREPAVTPRARGPGGPAADKPRSHRLLNAVQGAARAPHAPEPERQASGTI